MEDCLDFPGGNASKITIMTNSEFARDVDLGLSSLPKFLHSKYFYDDRGSELFQSIMNLDEYYLTDSEFEILELYRDHLLTHFQKDQKRFELIEFGAGDGKKTKVLLAYFLQKKADFKYLPIDISSGALDGLLRDLNHQFPDLQVQSICDDYFKALEKLKLSSPARKVVLFMGSNIGNFSSEGALEFLRSIQKNLNVGDLFLLGCDLKKKPSRILNAYDDRKGVTRAFNLNLLKRMNRELGANFDLDAFMHYPIYDPEKGTAKSFLVSTKNQEVYFSQMDKAYTFEAWESVHTETSQKYSLSMLDKMARESGFQVIKNFFDRDKDFCNSLWEVV